MCLRKKWNGFIIVCAFQINSLLINWPPLDDSFTIQLKCVQQIVVTLQYVQSRKCDESDVTTCVILQQIKDEFPSMRILFLGILLRGVKLADRTGHWPGANLHANQTGCFGVANSGHSPVLLTNQGCSVRDTVGFVFPICSVLEIFF